MTSTPCRIFAAAARRIGNEFLAGWSVSGSARSPADAEVRFRK